MAPNPATNLRLPPDVRAWLRETAATEDITLTELVARLVREYMDEPSIVVFNEHREPVGSVEFSAAPRKGGKGQTAAAAADEGGWPPCAGCGRPRNPDPGPYALHDAMVHAQCDQIVSNLEKEAEAKS